MFGLSGDVNIRLRRWFRRVHYCCVFVFGSGKTVEACRLFHKRKAFSSRERVSSWPHSCGQAVVSIYRQPAVDLRTDVTGVDVTGADAAGTDVTGADAAGADVTGIDVRGTDLTGMCRFLRRPTTCLPAKAHYRRSIRRSNSGTRATGILRFSSQSPAGRNSRRERSKSRSPSSRSRPRDGLEELLPLGHPHSRYAELLLGFASTVAIGRSCHVPCHCVFS